MLRIIKLVSNVGTSPKASISFVPDGDQVEVGLVSEPNGPAHRASEVDPPTQGQHPWPGRADPSWREASGSRGSCLLSLTKLRTWRVKTVFEQCPPSYLSQIYPLDKSLHISRAKVNVKGQVEAQAYTIELPFQNRKLKIEKEVFPVNKWQRQFSNPSQSQPQSKAFPLNPGNSPVCCVKLKSQL